MCQSENQSLLSLFTKEPVYLTRLNIETCFWIKHLAQGVGHNLRVIKQRPPAHNYISNLLPLWIES